MSDERQPGWLMMASGKTWHYGPTKDDDHPGKMWCYGCGREIFFFKEGTGCETCGWYEPTEGQ